LTGQRRRPWILSGYTLVKPVVAVTVRVGSESEGADVSTTCCGEFVREAVSRDSGSDHGLCREQLFGLYTSWCLLNHRPVDSPDALFTALRQKGIIPGHNTLAMKGPAAADYILASSPALT